LSHVLLGSTAEKIVRKAPCPVLTVKSNAAAQARVADTGPAYAAV